MGETCNVYLQVGEGEITADIPLNKLSEICYELEKWDTGVKEYVSNKLLDLMGVLSMRILWYNGVYHRSEGYAEKRKYGEDHYMNFKKKASEKTKREK